MKKKKEDLKEEEVETFSDTRILNNGYSYLFVVDRISLLGYVSIAYPHVSTAYRIPQRIGYGIRSSTSVSVLLSNPVSKNSRIRSRINSNKNANNCTRDTRYVDAVKNLKMRKTTAGTMPENKSL
ncbi:unnamed protein product [Prunus armeniaca]